MHASIRIVATALLALPIALSFATTPASADDGGLPDASVDDGGGVVDSGTPPPPPDASGPCGIFDFSSGINCKIEVSGGCTADCTPLKLEASCTGSCTASSSTTCTGNCGVQCIAQCDPAALDCFKGCHAECDGNVETQCKTAHPGDADCHNRAVAQCDIHCNDNCKVPDTSCSEHCKKCCNGGCVTQTNFDCDYNCSVNVQGGCNVQCTQPAGAIFCNGQYVHASDVQACIAYLATNGIKVDVSARGSATCDLSGCHGSGSASGCSASPGTSNGLGALAIGAFVVALGGIIGRGRRARK